MKDLNHSIEIYKEQLKKGHIQEAYISLVKYVTKLGSTLSKNHSERYSFGSLFQGYMDYTYFYYSNEFLKEKKLKMGLVLNHTKMQFEIWLLGQTNTIQEKYWEFFKSTKWNKNRSSKPQYSILETVILEHPDFNNLETLTIQIEENLLTVTEEIIHDIKASKLN